MSFRRVGRLRRRPILAVKARDLFYVDRLRRQAKAYAEQLEDREPGTVTLPKSADHKLGKFVRQNAGRALTARQLRVIRRTSAADYRRAEARRARHQKRGAA